MGRYPEAKKFLLGYADARQVMITCDLEYAQLEKDGWADDKLHRTLLKRKDEAHAQANRQLEIISTAIATMDKPIMRAVVSARYLQIDGMRPPTWDDVAARLCISKDYALKLHSGALAWLDEALEQEEKKRRGRPSQTEGRPRCTDAGSVDRIITRRK